MREKEWAKEDLHLWASVFNSEAFYQHEDFIIECAVQLDKYGTLDNQKKEKLREITGAVGGIK
jgi:hypothetical protein